MKEFFIYGKTTFEWSATVMADNLDEAVAKSEEFAERVEENLSVRGVYIDYAYSDNLSASEV